MPSRRRDGTERSVQDIISLLKQTDPDEVPAFVAKELHKLPPVTLDHVDVVSLLKDIRFLKEELAGVRGRLQASESTISDLRSELSQLKSNNSLCRSPDAAYVTRRRGAQASTFSPSALSDGSTNTAAADPARVPLPVAPTPSPQATQQNYATIAGRPAPPPRAKTNGEIVSRRAPESRKTKESRCKATKSRKVESSRPGKDESRGCDEEGFTLVERRKKKPAARNHRGTAPYVPELRLRSEVPATPLYISRLHWSMEVEDVVDYIQKKTTLRLRVERLQSRHKINFSFFVVRVPTNLLSTFEAPEFWPMDVVYRRFRGRLRNEARHVAVNT